MASEPSEVELTAESVKKLLIDIPDKYRGSNYTAEEISVISGAPLVSLAPVLNARSSWPGWAAIRIVKQDKVQLVQGGPTIRYYSPYSSSTPPSKNPMRSSEEREKNSLERPPVEAPTYDRESKRVKSNEAAASALEIPAYLRGGAGPLSSSSADETPMSDWRSSSSSASLSSAQRLLDTDLTVGVVDQSWDEKEQQLLLSPLNLHARSPLIQLLSQEIFFSGISKCVGASASLRLVLIGSSHQSNPQLFVRCNGFTANRIAFLSSDEHLLPRLEAYKSIIIASRKRIACDLSAHSTYGQRIAGVSDKRATGNGSFYVTIEPQSSTFEAPREKHVVDQAPELIGHVIRAPGCCMVARVARGRIPSHISVCPRCSLLIDPLNETINSQVRRQLQPISPYTPHCHVAQFPELAEVRMSDFSRRIRKLEADNKRLEALRFVEEHGEEMDSDPLVSKLNDAMLSVHAEGTKALEEAGCGDDTLELQIWNACVETAKTAQASGSKCSVRYPRFVIRFAMGLLARVGKHTYDSIRKAFQLPTGRHLRSFSSSSSSDIDGIMVEALADLKTLADRLELNPSQRRMFLAFDGCNLKSGVYFDANKNKIVGFASDFFDDVDIMEATRKYVRTAALENSSSKLDVLPLASTYMVFYLSAVQPELRLSSPIARFCISNSKAGWLLNIIPHVIAEAFNYSFRVVGVVQYPLWVRWLQYLPVIFCVQWKARRSALRPVTVVVCGRAP